MEIRSRLIFAIDCDIKSIQWNGEFCILGIIDCAIYTPIYRDKQLRKKSKSSPVALKKLTQSISIILKYRAIAKILLCHKIFW